MSQLILTTVPLLTTRIVHGYEGLGGFNASKNRYFCIRAKQIGLACSQLVAGMCA